MGEEDPFNMRSLFNYFFSLKKTNKNYIDFRQVMVKRKEQIQSKLKQAKTATHLAVKQTDLVSL